MCYVFLSEHSSTNNLSAGKSLPSISKVHSIFPFNFFLPGDSGNDEQLILNVVSPKVSQRKSECYSQKNTIKDQLRLSTARRFYRKMFYCMTSAHTLEFWFYAYFFHSTYKTGKLLKFLYTSLLTKEWKG